MGGAARVREECFNWKGNWGRSGEEERVSNGRKQFGRLEEGQYHVQYTDKSCLGPLVYGYYYIGGLFAHVHRKGPHPTGEPY